MTAKSNRDKILWLTTVAVLAALVYVISLAIPPIRIGPVSINFVLLPIVIGAVLCGPIAGAFLGLVSGVIVLFTDAALFFTLSIPGTIITVLLKGVLSGFCSGLVYKALSKHTYLAAVAAALVCPIVNTGVFLLGCFAFFLDGIRAWALAQGVESVLEYMIVFLVGINFPVELGINAILSPAIVTIIKNARKAH